MSKGFRKIYLPYIPLGQLAIMEKLLTKQIFQNRSCDHSFDQKYYVPFFKNERIGGYTLFKCFF